MTGSVRIEEALELRVSRCYRCGRFWAVEQYVYCQSTCPNCAGGKVAEMQKELEAARRRIVSYKGVSTRRKTGR